MSSIWRKPEILTVMIDIVVSGATLAAGKWLAPNLMDVALWAVGAFQAVSAVLVTHFATERIADVKQVVMSAVAQMARRDE